MANSADPDQLAYEEAQLIRIYIVCKDRTYLGSAGQGLIIFVCLSLWSWGLDVDLIVSVPEFTYLLYHPLIKVIHST